MNTPVNSKGFSLVEVLVALLLTTIGILGMVTLQGRSIQHSQDSIQRNTAVGLTHDFIEMIRGQSSQIYSSVPPKSPTNEKLKASSMFYKSKGSNFSGTAPCVTTANRIAETAQEQLNCWVEAVQTTLPGADTLLQSDMYVCRSSSPGQCNGNGSMLEIQLAWQTKENACLDAADPDATVCTYRVRVQL
jgi:type IV pilus assembly protein PilV